ncbi:MAG: hypothetical protein QNJ94_13615 [Alphaproteobacteria bacterium]|nr:hypothetical protein [Alphaproteobacteria bacterium]
MDWSLAPLSAVACALVACAETPEPHADGAPVVGNLRILFAEEKIYTTDFGEFFPRDDIVIFSADGTLVDNFTEYRTGLSQSYIYDEATESGRWRVRDGRLCIEGVLSARDRERCYRIEIIGAVERGPDVFRAVDPETGQSWKFVFARYVTLGWPWERGASWGHPFLKLTDRDRDRETP